MDTPRLISGRKSPMFLRLARTAFLCSLGSFAMAGAALAAPCGNDDCREGSGSLGLAMTAQELNLRSVDLGDADAAGATAVPDSVAPLLYLTPRVASILEEVFGDTEAANVVIDEAAPGSTPAAIADPAPEEDDPELYGPLSQAGNAEHLPEQLPKFQRQMYRTDI